MDKFIEKEVKSALASNPDKPDWPKPKPAAESSTMSAWRAEEVKNWTQALADSGRMVWKEDALAERVTKVQIAIIVKIEQLLGIADDK